MIPLADWISSAGSRPNAHLDFGGDVETAISIRHLSFSLVESIAASHCLQQAQNLRVQRDNHLRRIADELAGKIETKAREHADEIRGILMVTLRQWANLKIEDRAIDAFCLEVKAATERKLDGDIAISAPPELREKLLKHLELNQLDFEVKAGGGAEVEMRSGAMTVTSNISLWQDRLASLLT